MTFFFSKTDLFYFVFFCSTTIRPRLAPTALWFTTKAKLVCFFVWDLKLFHII